MKAIYKKELREYFYSPVGYIFVAIFVVFSGLMFSMLLSYGYADISSIFSTLTLSFFILPTLTMKMISDEKKNKTDQLLLTSKISTFSIVCGKALASLTVFCSALLITVLYPIVFSFYTKMNWGIVFTNYLGFILLGAVIISIGIYISSLTENQIISLIISVAVVCFLRVYDSLIVSRITNTALNKIFSWISVFVKFDDFMAGFIPFDSVIYFLSLICLFIFLTVRQIDKRLWIK